MTAPTPEGLAASVARQLQETLAELTTTRARLAAVTAERDQARQMLADAEKRIAEMELDESLREEDERFADPL